jgi:hypothetical protein
MTPNSLTRELCEISGFCRSVNEMCAFVGFYAAQNPTRMQISLTELLLFVQNQKRQKHEFNE